MKAESLAIPNQPQIHSPWREIQATFREVIADYRFQSATEHPIIIDAGANIGLSTLFFKWQYPKSKIIAIEPSPDSFYLLRQRVNRWKLTNVDLIPAALDENIGQRNLFIKRYRSSPFSRGGSACDTFFPWEWHKSGECLQVSVPTIPLSRIVSEAATANGKVDLLKIDIEGNELTVLREAETQLPQVDQIIAETHGFAIGKEGTKEIINLLTRNYFSVRMYEKLKAPLRRRIRIKDAINQENGTFMLRAQKTLST